MIQCQVNLRYYTNNNKNSRSAKIDHLAGIWPAHDSSHPRNNAAIEEAFSSVKKSNVDKCMLYEVTEFVQRFSLPQC